MTQQVQNGNSSFYALGVAPKLLEILDRMKFTTPMPIQHKAIPMGIEGKDIIGVAQTGTGKVAPDGVVTESWPRISWGRFSIA